MKATLALLILVVSLAAQTVKDITEFTIFKRNDSTRVVPGVEITVTKTDVLKQRFSIDLIVDGHKIEKKDLDIKVPFYFYVGANTQTHELVITKVAADKIEGRLASPK